MPRPAKSCRDAVLTGLRLVDTRDESHRRQDKPTRLFTRRHPPHPDPLPLKGGEGDFWRRRFPFTPSRPRGERARKRNAPSAKRAARKRAEGRVGVRWGALGPRCGSLPSAYGLGPAGQAGRSPGCSDAIFSQAQCRRRVGAPSLTPPWWQRPDGSRRRPTGPASSSATGDAGTPRSAAPSCARPGKSCRTAR